MQGVILDQYRQFVAARFGFRVWTRVLTEAGRSATQHYELSEVYPDEELGLLAVHTAKITAESPTDVLEGFGEAMVPEMLRIYSYLVDPKWTYAEFLLNMEPVLHQALRLHTPGAQPTKIHARRLGPQAVEVTYDSPLRACAAVLGVIRGAASEYGVGVDVSQDRCVLRGDPHCVFQVAIHARAPRSVT
jgi:heme-NO-binding protein